MNQYSGLDGHSKSCPLVVLNEKGKVKRKMVLETEEKQWLQFMKSIPGRRHPRIEEGSQGQWLYELFSGQEAGLRPRESVHVIPGPSPWSPLVLR